VAISMVFSPTEKYERNPTVLSRTASVPGEAWRLFQGGSPCRVRPNQPPVSSVADKEEEVNDDEQDIRSVHRESCGPQGRPHSPKRFSLVTSLKQEATVLAFRKPIQRNRVGEILECLPGSENIARRRRDARNLGGPAASLREGKADQPERRPSDGQRGVRSPVREYRTPGSARGPSGKRRSYLD